MFSLVGVSAMAVNPGPTATTNLQVGHYYRIQNVNSGRYMCYEKQDAGDNFSVLNMGSTTIGRKQPIIFIKKDKALTAPGTIFKLTSRSGELFRFECQGEDVNDYMNGKSVGYSSPQTASGGITVYNGAIYTDNVFDVQPINQTNSYAMAIRTKSGYDGIFVSSTTNGYIQDEGSVNADASYLSISSTNNSPMCQFFFEEVTGSGDAYLSLPLNDTNGKKTYNITYTIPNNGGTGNGSGTYGISDTQHNAVDGSYYTSACFSMPVVVPDNVFCYFINSQNKAIKVEFAEQSYSRFGPNINVMPAGIPFIVQTATNDPSEYKFFPLVPDNFITAKDPINKSVNNLKKANTYFVLAARNSSWSTTGNGVSGMRLLAVDASGEVLYPQTPTLGNSELTDGNRAYYGKKSEVIENKPTPVDLVDLIYEKENGSDKYTNKDFVSINDELVVGYVNQSAGIVFAHDKQNNKDYPDIQPVEQTPSNYFMFDPNETVVYPADYYQSNWVAINAPNEIARFTEGCVIPANTVTGSIVNDKNNPMFSLFGAPEATPDHDSNNAIENSYSVAHLAANNHELEAHGENYEGVKFWFMQPRAMEVATIVWAVLKYDEATQAIYAYVPKKTGFQNDLCFKGKVVISPLLYDGEFPTEEQLRAWDGQAFSFRAVIMKNTAATAKSPLRAVGDPYEVEETDVNQNYIICPLSISAENITTSIDEKIVDSLLGKVAKSVSYYNLQGIESTTPFDGVNIVVITYDDGTRSSMKLIK